MVSSLPGELIDSIWYIIDLDLKGLIPLENILSFDLINNDGHVTMHFSQEDSSVEMGIDLPLDILVNSHKKYMLTMMATVKQFCCQMKFANVNSRDIPFLKGCLFFLIIENLFLLSENFVVISIRKF